MEEGESQCKELTEGLWTCVLQQGKEVVVGGIALGKRRKEFAKAGRYSVYFRGGEIPCLCSVHIFETIMEGTTQTISEPATL